MSIDELIEPSAIPPKLGEETTPERMLLLSIAISLKRIADRLDRLSEPAAIQHTCEILAHTLKSYGIGR